MPVCFEKRKKELENMPAYNQNVTYHTKAGGENMAKSNRGKTLKKLPSRGRGTCPLCGKTRIKLLYTHVGESGQLKVCKQCNKK